MYQVFADVLWNWGQWVIGISIEHDFFAENEQEFATDSHDWILAQQVIAAGWSEYTRISKRYSFGFYFLCFALMLTFVKPGVPACEYISDDEEEDECEV